MTETQPKRKVTVKRVSDDPKLDGVLPEIEKHSRASTEAETDQLRKDIDEATGMTMTSIRLQKELIEDLKAMAKADGISYQPLVRQILSRYVREHKSKTG